MRPQSAKAKGRRLQQEVRDAVLAAFPSLEPDDVRSTSMGASGEDLLLSPAARKLFPYYVECKNVEALNVWKAFEQARSGAQRLGERRELFLIPLLVARRNNTTPIAVVPFAYLVELQKRANGVGA
jgi:hypothetical protein